MKTRFWQAVTILGLGAGCDRPAGPVPPAPAPVLKDESAAFFWFNSRTISDAGHPLYGRYVYERFLPHLAPAAQVDPQAWFVLCDGDCMTETRHLENFFRPEDKALLDQADRIGASLCYVVAALGQSTQAWEDVDRKLQASVPGYLGMTVQRRFDRKTFLSARENMALAIAARIDGARFKKIGFAFLTDDALSGLGFEPYVDRKE